MEALKEELKITGKLRIQLWDEFGKIKTDKTITNVIPPLGREHVADRLAALAQAAMGWMAIGTGIPTPTALATELSRVALTSRTRSTNVVTYIGEWAAGVGTGAITEAGIFNLATLGGIMLASQNFAVVNKLAADVLRITWTVTCA